MAEHENGESLETKAGNEGSGARRLAGVYADALLSAAEKRGQVEAIDAELSEVARELFGRGSAVAQLFESPVIKRTSKEPLLETTFAGKVSDLLYDFLRVLNRKDRLGLVPGIAAGFRELVDQRAKRLRVQVRAAVPLDDAQQERLRETLRAALHKDPVLDIRVDPDLLGGMVVQVGDDVLDSSVRTRIDNLRTQLLARSSHEIQVRRDRFSSAS
jgi:F-type H+-transporting ATPase subunit delta